MAKRLEGQVALVTGAASGNGRAIAFCLAAEGAKVLCVDMQEQSRTTGTEGSDTTHGQIVKQGGEAAFEKADVTKSEDVQGVIKAAVSKWGRLDIIVNNAGIFGPLVKFADEPDNMWQKTLDVNVTGVWLGTKYAIHQMRGQEPRSNERHTRGTIINIASASGLRIESVMGAYCTSKWAVNALTKCAARDHSGEGIRINTVCPGPIKTAMTAGFIADPAIAQAAVKQTPQGEWGTPMDIGKACVFLATDDAQWITGSAFAVDGGYSLTANGM